MLICQIYVDGLLFSVQSMYYHSCAKYFNIVIFCSLYVIELSPFLKDGRLVRTCAIAHLDLHVVTQSYTFAFIYLFTYLFIFCLFYFLSSQHISFNV